MRSRFRRSSRGFRKSRFASKARRFARKARRVTRFRRSSHRTLNSRPQIVTREFLYGSIGTANATGGAAAGTPYITVGGSGTTQFAQTVPLTLQAGTTALYTGGLPLAFSGSDVPRNFQTNVIECFEYYKLINVTLKFKPRWDNVALVSNEAQATGAVAAAPRLYMHTEHEASKLIAALATPPTNVDDIIKYGSHTVYDLTKQRMYHLKPSITMSSASDHSSGGGGIQAQLNTIKYNQWLETTPEAGVAVLQDLYMGALVYIEWDNPPLGTTVPANTTITAVDIFATYTFALKEIQE